MLMSGIWLGLLVLSVVFAAAGGELGSLSTAMLGGAQAAVELCISVAGALCLWSAIMEVMRRSGLSDSLSRLLRPLLRRIYPRSFSDPECAGAISSNFTANVLGLGNAATPAGLRAVERMKAIGGCENELCRLVVANSASLQLIPATLAAIRGSLGAAEPFDILPCVWLTSLVSLSVGLLAARLMERKEP